MKKIILVYGLLMVGCLIMSASLPNNISYKKSVKQENDIKNFNSIVAGGPLTVIVTLGNTEGIRFEGDQEAISTLVTHIEDNLLIIRPQISWISWTHKYKNKKIIAHVNAIVLKRLTMSGNGSLSVKGKISGASLVTVLSGSGQINANINVDDYTGVISGSGNLNIEGKANKTSITISGSGSFIKQDFETDKLKAVISGSGNISITANNAINALIGGSGSVNYIGNAKVSKRILGSGKVTKDK